MPSLHSVPALLRFACVLVLACATRDAAAAVIDGRVTASGHAVAGALVTVATPDGRRQETAYTDIDGRYRLDTTLAGPVRWRVRAPRFVEQTAEIVLGADPTRQDAALIAQQDARALSDALPASAHAATVRINDEQANQIYRSQCFFCHQIGNAWTRRSKTAQEWQDAVARMEKYGALITWGTEKEILRALPAAFSGAPVVDRQTHQVAPELARAKLTEVRLGDGSSFMHDVERGRDGRFYSVDMANDLIAVTDLASGETVSHKMPPAGLPQFGDFHGASMPVAAFNAFHGPHSIIEGPDGLMYTTNSLAGEIGVFDPVTRQYRFIKVGHGAIYPHTLRFDRDGILWFSIALSNQLGRYDPKTGEMRVIALPSGGFWRWLTDQTISTIFKIASFFPGRDLQLALSHHKWSGQGPAIMNLPYGLDIHPRDGSVWYSKLYGNKIGRYDPTTGAIKEYATPLLGPRRMRFGPDGTLWIPAYAGSGLLRFDPASETFETIALPTLAEGEFETPYALNIHPKSGDIWITSNLSDRMFRYIPAAKRWITYPIATQTSYMRDIVFTPDGKVCSMNANLPAGAVEGAHQQLVCLDPNANAGAL